MYNLRNLCITLILASTLMVGCGGNIFENLADSDSTEAKKEAAKIALDEGNYPEAVSILEGLCGTDPSNLTCDDDLKGDLASAYMAIATELDALKLIDEAVNATTGSFATISTLLPIGDINACVADPSSCTVQTNLDKAIEILDSLLPDAVPPDPTPEQKSQYLQLATASAVDVVVTIGIISDGLNSETGMPITPPGSVSTDDLTRVSNDLSNILLGLDGSGITDSDIYQDINTIKNGISTDTDVTETELITYINSL